MFVLNERFPRNENARAGTPEPRENIERPTSNTERRRAGGFALPFGVRLWMFGVGCSSGFMGRQGEGCRSGSWSRFASKFWRFLLSMNRTPVAASRQSAAGCCSHELRRSAETPLRQGSWSQCAVGKRSEEHTSELQSQSNLVCRLLLENK